MTPERLRHAQHLMADQTRGIPAICHDLGGLPASTLYHYLHPDGSLKGFLAAFGDSARTFPI